MRLSQISSWFKKKRLPTSRSRSPTRDVDSYSSSSNSTISIKGRRRSIEYSLKGETSNPSNDGQPSSTSTPSNVQNNAHGKKSNTNTRAKNLWQKVKTRYQLVDFHALPDYLRENEFILRHYRADWPLKETLLSIFSIHNETLNIWTWVTITFFLYIHLIGFLVFLCLTIYTAWQMPKVEYSSLTKFATFPTLTECSKLYEKIRACFPRLSNVIPSFFRPSSLSSPQEDAMDVLHDHQCILGIMKDDLGRLMGPFMQQPTTRWPFFIFLGGTMLCLFISSTCHLLCCHSSRLSYFLWRFDYAGIAAMIATSFFPPVYYTFLCHPMWRNFYLISISIIGLLTVTITLTPSLQNLNRYRAFRTLLFCGMGVFGVVPGIHKLMSHSDEQMTFATTTYEVLMGLFYGLGAIFYATRIPERWRPGSFDIAGHSHQIFHVLVLCGAYTHYKAALLYIEWRDKHGCD